MQNLEMVELFEWKPGQARPSLLCRVTVLGDDLAQRSSLSAWLKQELNLWGKANKSNWKTDPIALQSTLAMIEQTKRRKTIPRYTTRMLLLVERQGGETLTQQWCIRTGVGTGKTWKMSTQKDEGGDSDWVLWPQCQVAACLDNGRGQSFSGIKGKAFATLSTGIFTGYPVHINARWPVTHTLT